MDQIEVSNTVRKSWMSLLSKSTAKELSALWTAFDASPAHQLLRAPEIGSVMVQGRMGATGSGFNLGEVTITRCSVRLHNAVDGHAYVQGRDKDKALQAAFIDALMQTDAAERVQHDILDPLSRRAQTIRKDRAQKAAATKVDFFTLVRG
ncbi:MAG: phosphonate C-P lyase system protein PhnG [Roseobacter sp.]